MRCGNILFLSHFLPFTDAKNSAASEATLKELENIDDDTDKHDIHFVKIADPDLAAEYGVREFPALVYFEDKHPSVYHGVFLCLLIIHAAVKP